jgi:hypothetical protein
MGFTGMPKRRPGEPEPILVAPFTLAGASAPAAGGYPAGGCTGQAIAERGWESLLVGANWLLIHAIRT